MSNAGTKGNVMLTNTPTCDAMELPLSAVSVTCVSWATRNIFSGNLVYLCSNSRSVKRNPVRYSEFVTCFCVEYLFQYSVLQSVTPCTACD